MIRKILNVFLPSMLMLLSFVSSPARADVAVMLEITALQVTVQRVERQEPTELDLSDEAIKRRSAELQGKLPQSELGTAHNLDENQIAIEWLDASGVVVHREIRKDPRFVHDPDGNAVVMPDAIVLLRGPSAAVQLRIMPTGYTYFHEFTL